MITESEPEGNLFSQISHWDKDLFYLINVKYSSLAWDDFFVWLRTSNNWLPLYILILLVLIFYTRWQAVWWILSLVILITLSDGISSHFLKHTIGRARPFDDAIGIPAVRLVLNYRPSNPSFPSSHATNHTAAAIFFTFMFASFIRAKWLRWVIGVCFGVWALSIGYAQIYVGVHFPLDILGGICLGALIAYLHLLFIHPFLFGTLRTKVSSLVHRPFSK